MVQTMRFTFKADPQLYPPAAVMHHQHKAYFAVVVFEVEENVFKDIISSTVVGILPSQESRYQHQGCHRLNPGDFPWLKDVIMKHFDREEERMRVAMEKQRQWPQFHNGAGVRTPDDEPPSLMHPFLIP